MTTKKTLSDLYKFPGFRVRARLKPHPEDPEGYIITRERRQKKQFVPAVTQRYQAIVTVACILFEIWMPGQPACIWNSSIDGFPARDVLP